MEQALGAVKLSKARAILRGHNLIARRQIPWEWIEEMMLARLRADARLPCPHGGSNKERAREFCRFLPLSLAGDLDSLWED